MGLVLVAGPEGEPVVPLEVIQHLRLEEDTDEDELLLALTAAARELVEHKTHRALLTQTWRLTLDEFPAYCGPQGWGPRRGEIRLPKPPLQSVASVTYVDTSGATQTLVPGTDYVVDTGGLQGRIVLPYATFWPYTQRQANAVAITFVAGYVDAAAVPEALKAAIKLMLANFYENREATISGTIIAEVPLAVDALLAAYTVWEPA